MLTLQWWMLIVPLLFSWWIGYMVGWMSGFNKAAEIAKKHILAAEVGRRLKCR